MERVLYFQKVLQELMDEKDVDKKELAQAIGREVSVIENWFMGKNLPGAHALKDLADFFEVSADMLLDTKFDD